jgi:hypothetical protein
VCPIIVPIVRAGVFERYGTQDSNDHTTNIGSSGDSHHLFDKSSLNTNTSLFILTSLLFEMQFNEYFVHDDIDTSGTVEPTSVLLYGKFDVVAFAFKFMELRIAWLTIMNAGLNYSELVLRILVNVFACCLGSKFMQYISTRYSFANVARFTPNCRGYFVIACPDLTIDCRFDTSSKLATILGGMLLFWTTLIQGVIVKGIGWDGKQVQADLACLPITFRWYLKVSHENSLLMLLKLQVLLTPSTIITL